MSDTTITDEIKCLSLIEVMGMPSERREIALGVLRAIKERDEVINVIRETLEENRHLADGDDCTLRKLKAIVTDWK